MQYTPTPRSRANASPFPRRFRPTIEWLESRLQPGETFGLGFLGGALAGTALDLFSLPPEAVAPEQALARIDHPILLAPDVVGGTVSLSPGEHPASWDVSLAVGEHGVRPALVQPSTRTRDFDVLLEDLPILPGAIHRPQPAVPSGRRALDGGSEMVPAGVGAGHSGLVAPLMVPGAVTEGPNASANFSLVSPLSVSVSRLAPNSVAFDPWSGAVLIRSDGTGHTIEESLTSRGFLDVTLDGQPHSSDPASAAFDPLLAGATAARVAGIQLDGGQDTLTLGAQQLAGGLQVNAPGATVVAQDLTVGGSLSVQAADVTVRGTLRAGAVRLAAPGWVNIEDTGRVVAGSGETGGRLAVLADKFVNTGQLHADGATGGQITAAAGSILNAGSITADGSQGGGTVRISFTSAYIDTAAAVTSANGGSSGHGGQVLISGGSTGHLFSSGRQQATGGVGGSVDLLGRKVVLDGGTVDASGENGGGSIRVGGDFHGGNPAVANADTVTVTPAATLRADALQAGDGGRVAVWADTATEFQGAVSTRGGAAGGAGGFIEVSGRGNLTYGGAADAGAHRGQTGTLQLDPKNLIISAAPAGVFPQFDLIDPHPTPGGGFGSEVTVLSTGNIVVTNTNDNFGGTGAGAAYLFNGLSGPLLSALVGNNPGDQVGSLGTIALSNGNYVVTSPSWNGGLFDGRGAVTWGNGTIGVSGFISAANSLVGSNSGDHVGFGGVTALANGNYVVASPSWNGSSANRYGAVTWGSGTGGIRGTVSAANSLTGSSPYDLVGHGHVTALTNGNYVVASPSWNDDRGAATWGSGTTGVSGTVSAANSLVGSNPGDYVGGELIGYESGIFPLRNGNYLVVSNFWNGGFQYGYGAVTWGSGTAGISGTVSASNSLVGSNSGDRVGFGGATTLANGNYVVISPYWGGQRGAATWGNGTAGITGTISAANSLIGSNPGDDVGGLLDLSYTYGNVTALTNGNYVVASPHWSAGYGAATWGNGTTGATGTISAANSLIGSNPGDHVGALGLYNSGVSPLRNGNYVVASGDWNGGRGAATWGSGMAGVTGTISATNSLIGSDPGDHVADFSVVALVNGNYVVSSPNWNGSRGAATWGSGTAGVTGTISAANSLVGSNPGDDVADATALANGNYVVNSPDWNSNGVMFAGLGAVTWGSGTAGVTGTISAANSLVGSNPGDDIGYLNVTALANGNYVVDSPYWNGGFGNGLGAVTWGSGSVGIQGTISAANSLIGSNPKDLVGYNGVTVLSNGNYLVQSSAWNGGRGAVTWGNGSTGQVLDGQGVITEQNSLVGRTSNSGLGFISWEPVHGSLLVPFVNEGDGRLTVGLSDPNQFTYARAQSQTVTLTPDFLTATLDTGTAVVLQASNDITVDDPITVQAGGHGSALTLQAGRSILLNASITTNNGPLTLIANDTRADGVVDSERDPGNATIVMAGGTALDTGTASLDIELRDGAGLTHADSRGVNLQTLTAGAVTVVNDGPDAGSDIRVGAVTTSGPQSYSAPHGVTTVTADLTTDDAPITFTDSVVVNDGVNVDAGSGTVDFIGDSTQTLQTGDGVSFSNLNHTGSGTLQLTGALAVGGTLLQSAGIFDANDQPVTVGGAAVLTGGTYLAGMAPQTFGGGLVITAGDFTSSTGPMTVRGGVTLTGGTFGGPGSVDQLTVYGGTVAPGTDTPGILNVAGAVAFNPLTTFTVLLDGTHAGRGYSQLRAAGLVDLGGSVLQLVPGFEPPLGRALKILTAAGGVQGTFAGLPEGAVFDQGGLQFQITYHGGAHGRSVVLTRIG